MDTENHRKHLGINTSRGPMFGMESGSQLLRGLKEETNGLNSGVGAQPGQHGESL